MSGGFDLRQIPKYARTHLHYLIAALYDFGGQARRSNVLKRVAELERVDGKLHKKNSGTFEKAIQRVYNAFCGQSDVFLKSSRKWELFRSPKGKWEGTWGLNLPIVEKYLKAHRPLRDDEL
jgi:hypothetical protein